MVRDELLERFRHYAKQIALFDKRLEELRQGFPQVEALLDIRGIGLYSALLIIAEIGEVERFRTAKQIGAYTGLTSRVHQSGGHCYQGSITRQGSPWLRWVLVQAAMKAVHGDDLALQNFYRRIRKRSGAKIARVAAARKLAEICWKRLRQWHRQQASHGIGNKPARPLDDRTSFRAATRSRVARQGD
jgi:transposase